MKTPAGTSASEVWNMVALDTACRLFVTLQSVKFSCLVITTDSCWVETVSRLIQCGGRSGGGR